MKAKGLAKEKGTSYKKTDADGLAGRFKIFGQIMLGIIIGATLYFNDSVVVKREENNLYRRVAIVVFPFVPVTPTSFILRDG